MSAFCEDPIKEWAICSHWRILRKLKIDLSDPILSWKRSPDYLVFPTKINLEPIKISPQIASPLIKNVTCLSRAEFKSQQSFIRSKVGFYPHSQHTLDQSRANEISHNRLLNLVNREHSPEESSNTIISDHDPLIVVCI